MRSWFYTVDSASGAADGGGGRVPDETGVPGLPGRGGQVPARTRSEGGRS